MTTAHTIIDLAGIAYSAFHRVERGEKTITTLADDAPDWLHDLVHEAHGDMLPDDWRYDVIREALGFIHENGGDLDDLAAEFADDVDVYSSALLEWLASNLTRAGYCDTAAEELGSPDSSDIMRLIGMGQYLERREVFDSVRQSLEELIGDE